MENALDIKPIRGWFNYQDFAFKVMSHDLGYFVQRKCKKCYPSTSQEKFQCVTWKIYQSLDRKPFDRWKFRHAAQWDFYKAGHLDF